MFRRMVILLAVLLGLPVSANPDEIDWKPIFRGIEHASIRVAPEATNNEAGDPPAPTLAIEALRVDPNADGIVFDTSPSNSIAPRDTQLITTSGFVRKHRVSVAVNTSFFGPGGEVGDNTDLVSLSIRRGRVVSPWEVRMPDSLVIRGRELSVIDDLSPELDGIDFAVAGNLILHEGEIDARGVAADSRHPRTALGITEDGRLLMVVVDGRRPGHSDGVTLEELAQWMIRLGAVHALNVDGGGSSTMVRMGADGPEVMNKPSDGQERPVGASIGVRALPLIEN